jgi:Fe-S-cluster containining protein
MQLSDEHRRAFRSAVQTAAGRAEVGRAVATVYAALADAIELRKPICKTSGRCCRFDEFGHQLFVTTMEMAAFVRQQSVPAKPSNGGCPFQIDGLCTVHTIRPFGCRIFFCDETSTQWQQEQYERFHQEFKRLHERLAVPYFYVEWRQALAAVHSCE